MEVLVLLVIVFFAGAIGGLFSVFQVFALKRELQQVRERLSRLEASGEIVRPSVAQARAPETATKKVDSPESVASADAFVADAATEDGPPPHKEATADEPSSDTLPKKPGAFEIAMDSLSRNWMIWLGGVCVTLAGVFLVHYSIERGLLGPVARIVAGLMFGAGLHITAEWLRRRTGGTHPAFSALAGAGSITLYASVLAALRLYDLIEPGPAFLLMAVIAFITIAMAWIHGPVLAAFGILGAYLVPILVSTGGGHMVVAMIYVLIVSGSALVLLRYIYRRWLWVGVLTGTLAWWLLSLGSSDADGFRVVYLSLFAWGLFAIPSFDWRLSITSRLPDGPLRWRSLISGDEPDRFLPIVMLGLCLLAGVSIIKTAGFASPWFLGLPFMLLALWLGRQREALFWLPWSSLLILSGAWLLAGTDTGAPGPRVAQLELLAGQEQSTFLLYLAVNTAVICGLSFFSRSDGRFNAWPTSVLALAPVSQLGLAYLLTGYPEPNTWWGLVTATAAAAYLALATAGLRRRRDDALVVWLFIGGHAALSLAAALVLREATLTLALAAQIGSLAWIIRSFDLPRLGWVFKLVVLAVIVRLTLNPWLADYPTDVHWTLWTYGGATVFAVAGWRLLQAYPAIARWAEGAALHLFVLAAWTELRYQLYDGAVYSDEFTALEATLSMLLFGALSLVYQHRAQTSSTLARLYRGFSLLLLLAAAGNYGALFLRLLGSSEWLHGAVSATPVLNLLLAAFGLPILLGLLVYRYHEPFLKRGALAFSGFAGFVFASVEVRHLWSGTANLGFPAVSSAELYTYSAVWLVLAVITMLAGISRYGQTVYRAGLALLALVIAKLFLVDMSDLEGLLRVASFLGLGLSLLGLSYLHQRLTGRNSAS